MYLIILGGGRGATVSASDESKKNNQHNFEQEVHELASGGGPVAAQSLSEPALVVDQSKEPREEAEQCSQNGPKQNLHNVPALVTDIVREVCMHVSCGHNTVNIIIAGCA